MDWYAAVVWPSRERRVARTLLARARHLGMDEIGRTSVPLIAQSVKDKHGKPRTRLRVAMPGYVLIQMEATPEAVELVRHTSGVRGFAGTRSWEPRRLVPIPASEVDALLALASKPAPSQPPAPSVGARVRVRSGPLADRTGKVVELLSRDRAIVELDFGGPVEIPIDALTPTGR
jgi:transcription antitermination factor NusG